MSNIYNDLKKYSGNCAKDNIPPAPAKITVTAKKLAATRLENAREPISVEPELTIEQIISMIKPPLMPFRDASGILYDNSTIVIRCPRAHIHKYYISDVIAAQDRLACITCASGTIFMITVREFAELLLGAPFILSSSRLMSDANSLEYVNLHLKIVIMCSKLRGDNYATTINGFLLLKIYCTESLKKIKDAMYEYLHGYDALSETQRKQVNALRPFRYARIAGQPRRRPYYKKNPLPYAPELANLMPNVERVNTVVDESLYFENCCDLKY